MTPHAPSAMSTARFFAAARSISQTLPDADLVLTPAWDMLLALFVSADRPRGFPEARLLGSTDAPVHVATRWLKVLGARGLVRPDDDGAGRLGLTDAAEERLTRYFDAVAALGPD